VQVLVQTPQAAAASGIKYFKPLEPVKTPQLLISNGTVDRLSPHFQE